MKTYNWAVLGCGKIAEKFSKELDYLPNANKYAAGSRSLETAQSFANRLGYEKAFGSYDELVKDDQVDIIYVATPHSFHKENTLLCLEHNKAVLCEKAFAMNTKEVQEMIESSKHNQTFLMEAFWQAFKPKFYKIQELIQQNDLGKLLLVKSDFTFNSPFNPDNRLYNLDLGGGSLLDIGIYPVFTALSFLGKPDSIATEANFSKTGSEETISIVFKYENGAMAQLFSSFRIDRKNDCELCFENGVIKYDRFSHDPIEFQFGDKTQYIPFEHGPDLGYEYEAKHVMECLDNKLLESPIMTFERSLELMETLDWIRKDAGIVFPNHDT